MQRRHFLKGSLTASAAVLATGAGLITPRSVLADWPKAAFTASKLETAMNEIAGGTDTSDGQIKIKAPEIAENGAVVPITVTTDIENIESISLFAEANNAPLVASFQFGKGAIGEVSTRIKMAKTANVIAVVKADGKLYSSKQPVKVTIGGCGG